MWLPRHRDAASSPCEQTVQVQTRCAGVCVLLWIQFNVVAKNYWPLQEPHGVLAFAVHDAMILWPETV
eukprot:12885569-Prorocentrum_lima.AAC.1